MEFADVIVGTFPTMVDVSLAAVVVLLAQIQILAQAA
jgi:hypothetical protein